MNMPAGGPGSVFAQISHSATASFSEYLARTAPDLLPGARGVQQLRAGGGADAAACHHDCLDDLRRRGADGR